jgi:hypothetical protein
LTFIRLTAQFTVGVIFRDRRHILNDEKKRPKRLKIRPLWGRGRPPIEQRPVCVVRHTMSVVFCAT